ncbi:deoxyribodipyrimidine photo-lyase [Pseudolysinimonas kribbensis]|uniref:Deoxyribodipyrimidine photo-lyase n=1 Tax=Pseudolysinimonas kribbensis TaxID=433641 RepID=A0ABQ6K5H6_9MICO|nr:deoxyribodipyrimidine photo-lyase [Pseudolysinimonas kribbensis]GMA94835.1 deoxyribodipyrimidine photo-lyase [Pseudolysinimonas kribbensis]
MTSPAVVWLRDDLRIADNPALRAGVDRGGPVVALYVLDDESPGIRPLGGATRWWLHHSLAALDDAVASRGGRLVLRRGPAAAVVPTVVAETGAGAVFWNRRYGASREIDARLKATLRADGVEVASFAANLLHEPWTVATGRGGAFQVFTPFWRAAQQLPVREPVPTPREVPGPRQVDSEELHAWALLPTRPDWAAGLRARWEPGEDAAHRRVERFATEVLADYHERDIPAQEATSLLSPRLRFGELSPVQLWHRVHGELSAAARRNVGAFLRELGWREFDASILYHRPDVAERNVRAEFDAFPWQPPREAELAAWQQGRTGIPLVDAGMRELWTTGYLPNRVRMVVASFLVKNLLADWRIGEAWFWDTLVDADEADNPANWQWVAGSGADAAPYFRVFNPELQARRFDPHGEYVRRWVPEAGTDAYRTPIVDLAASRADALAAFEHMRAANR